MILRKFYISVVIRVIFLALTTFILAWSLLNIHNLFTILVAFSLVVIQTVLLILYINRINKNLEHFLTAIRNEDTSITYDLSSSKGIYRNLKIIMDEINRSISKIRIEKEHQYQYLQYIIEHIEVALLVFNREGEIELLNRATVNMFQSPQLKTIYNFNKILPGLDTILVNLKPSEKRLIIVPVDHNLLNLAVRKSRFKLENKEVSLISFQDINAELDQKELESWQKLIRVLRHEIMNTVSPVVSLSTTISRIFLNKNNRPKNLAELSENNIADTLSGLDIIGKRSQGILDFVGQYKKFTSLPQPDFQPLNIYELLEDVSLLLKNETTHAGVNLQFFCPAGLSIYADRNMIEQILINLIKNSLEALEETENPVLRIKAYVQSDGRTIIQVTDNGRGITDEIIENIFVPFYSTKDKGSGIGLTLARQFMNMHKGSITVKSVPEKKTVFSLVF